MIYKILSFLGCTPTFQCKVKGEPQQVGGNWIYDLTPFSKTYRIFGIKIYIKKY